MIGNQIKKLLNANEMTQNQLAQKMSISDSKMSKILNGSLEPNLTDLKLLSEIFNVSIDEIIMGESSHNVSLIEDAIKSGYESFKELIKRDPSWLNRKDDKDHDMIYYIKKYEAYDYLSYFYQNKDYQWVPSGIQVFYVKMVKTLMEKKMYEEYLRIDATKHSWNFSIPNLSPKDEEKLGNINHSSDGIIYEIVNKNNEKPQFYKEFESEEIGMTELENYYIYIYAKRVFRKICDKSLMKQNANPKFIVDHDRRIEYTKTYLANNLDILRERIKEIKEQNYIPQDIDTINEALFLGAYKKEIEDIMEFQIDIFNDIDLEELRTTKNEANYMDELHRFNRQISQIKSYLKLCVKYNDLNFFKKLLSNPKYPYILNCGRKSRVVIGEYGSRQESPKYFDFEMSFEFQKAVLEQFPESINEINFNWEEIIKSENIGNYKFALDYLDKKYFKLPFMAQHDIERLIKRPLIKLDFKKLINTYHSIIMEFNQVYLNTGKLDYDGIYKSLLDKSSKNTIFKYFLVKIWINVPNVSDYKLFSNKQIDDLFENGIQGFDKNNSTKERVIDYMAFNFPTYIDNLFLEKNLYTLLSEIKNNKFFEMIVFSLNPHILGQQIKEKDISFSDLEKIKFLLKEITNELSNKDLALLNRALL